MNPRIPDSRHRPIALHGDESTEGSECHMCACLEVLVTSRRGVERKRYWCSAMHCHVEPFGVGDCKLRR